MTAGTENFIIPLKTTAVTLSSGSIFNYSARFLEIDLYQPVVTHYDLQSTKGVLKDNQEGILFIEFNTVSDYPTCVGHCLISKYGPILLVQEVFTRDDDNRVEMENMFWDAAERMAGLTLSIPNNLEGARLSSASNSLVKHKKMGLVETLLHEHFQRREAIAKTKNNLCL